MTSNGGDDDDDDDDDNGDDGDSSHGSDEDWSKSSVNSDSPTDSSDDYSSEDLRDIDIDPDDEGEDPEHPIPTSLEGLMDVIGTLGQGLYVSHARWRPLLLTLFRKLLQYIMMLDAGNGYEQRKVKATAALSALPGLVLDYNQQTSRDRRGRPSTVDWLTSLCADRPTLVTINMILSQSVQHSKMIRNKESRRYQNGGGRVDDAPRYPSQRAVNIHLRNGRLSRVMRGVISAGSDAAGFFKGSEEDIKLKVRELNPNNDFKLYPDWHAQSGEHVDQLKDYADQLDNNIDITPEVVRSVLSKLPRDSANGVSGWTFNLLRDIINNGIHNDDDEGTELMELITSFVLQMVKFKLPVDCYYILNSARQVLLQETPTKVRPISIGDVLFRFAAKCLMVIVQDNIQHNLAPIQLCIGTKGGTEIGALLAQSRYDRGLMQHFLDGANAFSTMARRNIEQGIEDAEFGSPQLIPFFHASYGRPTELRVTTERGRNRLMGWSSTGVRQGDPLGMVLYSLGIHKTLLEINSHMNNAKLQLKQRDPLEYEDLDIDEPSVSAYADDAGVNAPPEAMASELDFIIDTYKKTMWPADLNISKGQFIGTGANDEFRDLLSERSNYQNEIAQAQFCQHGAKVLGVQIGTNEHIKECTTAQLRSKAKSCDYLLASPLNAQTKYALLAKCINAKQWYTARNTPPTLAHEGLTIYDKAVDKTLAILSGQESLKTEQKVLRGLPKWTGGMGLTRADGPAGHVAYIKRTRLVKEFLIEYPNFFAKSIQFIEELPLTHICHARSSLGLLNASIPQSDEIFQKRNALLRDTTLNAVINIANEDGSNNLYSKLPDEHTTSNFLIAANQIIHLELLKGIIKDGLTDEHDANHVHDQVDTQEYAIEGRTYHMNNKSLIKSKLAWLISGVSTPNSESGPPGKKVTTWNIGGLQLEWSGRAFGDYATMSDPIFRSYLCSRLYLPLTGRALLCNTEDHGIANGHRHAINIRDAPLHGLLCKGMGVAAFGTRRHTNALYGLQSAVHKIVTNAPPQTLYEGSPIGECTVVTGAADKFYQMDENGNNREIVADTVITLRTDSEQPTKLILDLTIREPHASRFVNGTGANARLCPGQAAAYGTSTKELRYRPVVDDHVKLFPIVIESNGYVSRDTHEFISILKEFSAPDGAIHAIQRKIAGAIAVQNAMAIAEKYSNCYYQIPQIGDIANVHINNGVHHVQEAGEHRVALEAL